MYKLKKKVKFSHSENLMRQEGDVKSSLIDIEKNNNLKALLHERFDWMNEYIKDGDVGIEVGAAAGFSKKFIKCKNFKIKTKKTFIFY